MANYNYSNEYEIVSYNGLRKNHNKWLLRNRDYLDTLEKDYEPFQNKKSLVEGLYRFFSFDGREDDKRISSDYNWRGFGRREGNYFENSSFYWGVLTSTGGLITDIDASGADRGVLDVETNNTVSSGFLMGSDNSDFLFNRVDKATILFWGRKLEGKILTTNPNDDSGQSEITFEAVDSGSGWYLSVKVNRGDVFNTLNTSVMELDNWHLIGFYLEFGNSLIMKIYYDGEVVGNSVIDISNKNESINENGWFLGGKYAVGTYSKFSMYNLGIWKRELSLNEVKYLYNNGNGREFFNDFKSEDFRRYDCFLNNRKELNWYKGERNFKGMSDRGKYNESFATTFSSVGEVRTNIVRDKESLEISPYNNINYRNLSIKRQINSKWEI